MNQCVHFFKILRTAFIMEYLRWFLLVFRRLSLVYFILCRFLDLGYCKERISGGHNWHKKHFTKYDGGNFDSQYLKCAHCLSSSVLTDVEEINRLKKRLFLKWFMFLILFGYVHLHYKGSDLCQYILNQIKLLKKKAL